MIQELFDPENRFWNFMGKVADVTMLSVLWLITSLPVITIGAATASLCDFTFRAVRDQEGMVWHSWTSGVRRHFKKATGLGLIAAAGILFFTADLAAALRMWISGIHAGLALAVFLGILFLLYLCIVLYAFGILVVFGLSIRKILRDAPVLVFRYLPETAGMVLILILGGCLTYWLSGFFFFWVGGVIFASSYLMDRVFHRISV